MIAMLIWSMPPKTSAQECSSEACAGVGEFEVSVALGAGVRTNPLHSGSHFPLIIVPDIAWYGEQFYLDNTEVGFQWYDTETVAFETFLNLNGERGYFSRGHASNFFLSSSAPDGSLIEDGENSGSSDDVNEERGGRFLGIDDVGNRDWAIDAGARIHFYFDQTELQVSAYQDISNVHKGQQLNTTLIHTLNHQKWRVSGAIGLTWKSEKLLDYYYGIDARDNVDMEWFYQARSGLFPSLRLSVSRELNAQWRLFTYAKYTHLDKNMTDSPLVDENQTITLFGGVTYRF